MRCVAVLVAAAVIADGTASGTTAATRTAASGSHSSRVATTVAATVERRVRSGNDDAEESASGRMYLESSDLELVYDDSNQVVGLRFGALPIPNGATVTRAYVQFTAAEAQTEATTLVVRGQAADNAAAFASERWNVSRRQRTSSSVNWTPRTWTVVGEAGAGRRTPDISALVQEIVHRPGWVRGNALALIVTGRGHRTAHAFEGSAAEAALLHVEFRTGTPVAPVSTARPTIAGIAEVRRTLRAAKGAGYGTPPITYAYTWRRCDKRGLRCANIAAAGRVTYALSRRDAGHTIRVAITARNRAGSTTSISRPTPVVGAAGSTYPVIAAAGDLCGSPTSCAPTAALLGKLKPDRVLTLGDNAYESGTLDEFMRYYHPNWGRYRAKTSPSPGNHDYNTPGASGYFTYFGSRVPGPYYSFDLGAWHLISLNSQIDVSAGSPQERWLRADLAAHRGQCILAYWHEPRFSSASDHGSDASLDPLWRALYAAGADVVLNGHNHSYERFAPQSPDGVATPGGIRQFIVGTGGWELYGFGTPIPNSEVRNGTAYGVLKLTLRPAGYSWLFVPAAGYTFSDAGSGSCQPRGR